MRPATYTYTRKKSTNALRESPRQPPYNACAHPTLERWNLCVCIHVHVYARILSLQVGMPGCTCREASVAILNQVSQEPPATGELLFSLSASCCSAQFQICSCCGCNATFHSGLCNRWSTTPCTSTTPSTCPPRHGCSSFACAEERTNAAPAGAPEVQPASAPEAGAPAKAPAAS